MTDQSEPIQPFLRESIEIVGGEEHFVTLHDMYDGYKRWCVATGHQPGSKHYFFAQMNRLPIGGMRKPKRANGVVAKAYVGVRWHHGHGPERIGGF
jgi:hypothetical protein